MALASFMATIHGRVSFKTVRERITLASFFNVQGLSTVRHREKALEWVPNKKQNELAACLLVDW